MLLFKSNIKESILIIKLYTRNRAKSRERVHMMRGGGGLQYVLVDEMREEDE